MIKCNCYIHSEPFKLLLDQFIAMKEASNEAWSNSSYDMLVCSNLSSS